MSVRPPRKSRDRPATHDYTATTERNNPHPFRDVPRNVSCPRFGMLANRGKLYARTLIGDECFTRKARVGLFPRLQWGVASENGQQGTAQEGNIAGSVANFWHGRSESGHCHVPLGQAGWKSALSLRRATASASAPARIPKARSTMRASPRMSCVRLKLDAWPLRRARITSNPRIVA